MKRRDVFPILGASAAFAQQSTQQPKFFDAAQYRTLEALADTILPHEADVPGALEVQAPWFIDTTLYYTQTAPRRQWVDGLKLLSDRGFADLKPADRIALLQGVNEAKPQSPLDRFFVMAKRQIVDAWAMSADGMRRGLGYRGNVVLQDFHGHD